MIERTDRERNGDGNREKSLHSHPANRWVNPVHSDYFTECKEH